MAYDINAIKNQDLSEVIAKYIDLKKDGVEFKACCPFHDERTPSFSVNDQKGFYYCFGCGAQGDAIDFVMEYTGVDFKQACEDLGAGRVQDGAPTQRQAPERVSYYDDYTPEFIPPGPLPNPLKVINPKRDHELKTYRWDAAYPYGNQGYVLRMVMGDGKKITPTVRYCNGRWVNMPFPEENRWAYKREIIKPEGQVFIPEGEKAADYLSDLLAQNQALSVVSWAGGTNAVARTDWSFLEGRSVVLMPDNDEGGFKAMRQLRDILVGHGCQVKSIVPDDHRPKGWDVADATWTYDELIQWAKAQTKELPADPNAETAKPQETGPADQPDNVIPISAYQEDQPMEDCHDWEPPLDILAKFQAPELDINMLPPALQPFVFEKSQLLGVDPAILGVSALVVCASAIHDEIKIQPKEFETGWTESARIWAAVVGDPSVKKSPAIKAASSPISAIDNELADENGAVLDDYNLEMKIYKDQEKAYIKAAVKAKESGDENPIQKPQQPRQPDAPRAKIGDTTIEAMTEVMRYNPRGILCLRDELSGWFGSMDAYSGGKGGKDRPLWLEAYNGGPQSIDRIGRGSYVVPNWSACMLGGIQPEKMAECVTSSGEDGLLQRFMVVSARPAQRGVDRPEDHSILDGYKSLVRNIFNIEPFSKSVKFSMEAQAVRMRLEDKIFEMRESSVVSGSFLSHISKWEGLFPRLCLVYHVIDCSSRGVYPTEDISLDTAEAVYSFMMGYLFKHSAQFYIDGLAKSENMERTRWVAGYILANESKTITRRDISRSYRQMRNATVWEFKKVMSALEAAEWVRPDPNGNTCQDGVPKRYVINPQIHEQFAARAEKEKATREKAKAVISDIIKARQ